MTATKLPPNNGSYIAEVPRSRWQEWTSVSTLVQVSPTSLNIRLISETHLDPANGVGLKIWQCFDNLPAQQWFYTDDNRIALEGQGTSAN
jgi:hypothetical protein